MPIYKVAAPLPAFGAKYRGFEVSQSVAAASTSPHGHNGSGEVRLVQEDTAGHSKDAERGHALPSPPEVQHRMEPTQVVVVPGRRETLIEREVREQLRREAELASRQGPHSTISFAGDTDATRHNIRVISSTDVNGGRRELNHHVVPDSVGLSREGGAVVGERTVVVVSTSPDGGVHRTTTTTTTTTGGSGGGGSGGGGGSVKTSNEGTPGGSWILHELQAQAAREKELRKHRKEMGWEVEERGHGDNDGEMDQVRYSGGTWADQRVELDVVDSRGMEEHQPVVPDILVEGPGDNNGTLSFDHHHRARSPAAGRRNTQKVQPFEDVERIQSEIQMIYVPQNETPIDREIRLQREREEALRMSRGIFTTVHGSSPEIEVEVLRPRPIEEGAGPTSGDLGLSMKKFAESRLRNELEREKKRELDLLKEGKIIVLSADRTPDAMTFVETISPEKVELRELARKISAERQSGLNDAASKEIAWNEVTLRDSTTPRNETWSEISWQEATSRDNTIPRNGVSTDKSWHDVTPRIPAPRNVASKDITSHNSAPRGKTWNNVAPIETTTTKKVVLVELPQKEHLHLEPVHVEVHNGHGNDDRAFVDAKVQHTPSPKSETHLTVTRSTERSGRGIKTKSVSPNSYSEEDVQKILLTVAERRIEEEIAETKKRELELRELRKHRLSSEIPREPEDINNNNNAHAHSSVSVKIETDHKSPSPQPIRDGNRRDDVAEVHVTTAFDDVDFHHHQQPTDGQGEVRARRLALIDQWERGIIQRSD